MNKNNLEMFLILRKAKELPSQMAKSSLCDKALWLD